MTHAVNTSAVPSGALAAGLARLGQDDGRAVNLALIALEGNPDALARPQWAAAMKAWIDAFFDQAEAKARPGQRLDSPSTESPIGT